MKEKIEGSRVWKREIHDGVGVGGGKELGRSSGRGSLGGRGGR
jgi:hypothetical protein